MDIDAAVLALARRFFPKCAAGLDDPRTTVHVGDGARFAAEAAARSPDSARPAAAQHISFARMPARPKGGSGDVRPAVRVS